MAKIYGVIVNPNAGNKKGIQEWPLIEKKLLDRKIEFRHKFTQDAGHAVELTKDFIESGIKYFIVVGGDGTLNEVLNGIYSSKDPDHSKYAISNIPVGTGNDWCRTYKIPHDTDKAVDIISKCNLSFQDVGRLEFENNGKREERYFMNVAGLGFDAFVAFQTNQKKKEGKGSSLIYLYTLFKSLFRYKSTMMTIKAGGREFSDVVFSMSVGIGKYNGGGMMQLPNAVPNDGVFEITIIKKMTKLDVLKNIRRLYDGSIIYHPKVEIMKGSSISIISDPPVALESDGEKCGLSPVKVSMIHKGISVIIPD